MNLETIDFKKFPTTRYQGSKRKILPWIYENVKELHFESALDACGGSASVSYLFKRMNKVVTYNDNLKFNHLIGKAIIENNEVKFTDEDIVNLLSSNNGECNIIQKYFNDIYYPKKENKWLDNVSSGIMNMNHYTGDTLSFKKSLAYYALFQASLTKRPFNLFHRNNLHIRTADVKRNFGNKTTWEKDFEITFKNFVLEANGLIFDSGKACFSTNQSILDLNEVNYDLVYVDPPYLRKDTGNETSNYLKCYHFLEGITNYDTWEGLIDFESRNYRFKDSAQNAAFCKENIYETFELFIEKFRKSIIVISYKKGGIPSIDYIVKVMKRFKKNVSTRSQQYIYALNRQNGNAKENREVLIIGK